MNWKENLSTEKPRLADLALYIISLSLFLSRKKKKGNEKEQRTTKWHLQWIKSFKVVLCGVASVACTRKK